MKFQCTKTVTQSGIKLGAIVEGELNEAGDRMLVKYVVSGTTELREWWMPGMSYPLVGRIWTWEIVDES